METVARHRGDGKTLLFSTSDRHPAKQAALLAFARGEIDWPTLIARMSAAIPGARQTQATPAVVAELDAVINAAVASARSDAEVSRWLHKNIQIKRALVALPADALEREAAAALAMLRESA